MMNSREHEPLAEKGQTMSRIEEALAKANRMRLSNGGEGKGPDPAPPAGSRPATGKRRWWFCVGIFLALAVGFGMHRYVSDVSVPSRPKPVPTEDSVKLLPAAKQATPSKSPPRENGLPSSIPLNSPDRDYPAAHPGWQRYRTESLEFRVFREESAVKAIQVIARREKAITAGFLASFLAEIAGKESFRVQSKGERDGLFVEKGRAGNTADVIIYRRRPAGEIRALVVAYL